MLPRSWLTPLAARVAVHTPNIDRLGKGGLVMNRAFCQQAICGPTRNSFMVPMQPMQPMESVSRMLMGSLRLSAVPPPVWSPPAAHQELELQKFVQVRIALYLAPLMSQAHTITVQTGHVTQAGGWWRRPGLEVLPAVFQGEWLHDPGNGQDGTADISPGPKSHARKTTQTIYCTRASECRKMFIAVSPESAAQLGPAAELEQLRGRL